jgi:hypothetical protein
MRFTHVILLGILCLAPVVCTGQTKCPWIAEATARGILGGDVKATAKITERHDGVCDFSRQQGSAQLQLRISVDIMTNIPKQFPAYLAQCAASDPLPAIGNEAVTCRIEGKDGLYAERVVGRVRNQAFVITVSSSQQNDETFPPQMRRDKVRLAAEQVSGILF